MTGLLETQRAFAAELRRDSAAAACLDVVGAAPARRARLAIYRRSVEAARVEALAATYPITRALIGEACFQQVASHHARAFPSGSGDLNDYGGEFAGFLAGQALLAGLPYLPDVARLEWAMLEVARAPDAARFDFDALASVPQESHDTLRFRLCPACRVIASPHPLFAIYCLHQALESTARAAPVSGRVLVIRRAGGIEIEALDAGTGALCAAFERGERFANALAETRACEPGCDVAGTLRTLIARGVVSGFTG